jgi:type IV pilus assembly protein PilN
MIRINLLSDREAIRKETTRQQVSIFVLMICLLVVILGGLQFYQYQKKKDLQQQIVDVRHALKELEKQVGEVEKYKEAKKELETKLQIIERLQKGKLLVVQLLDGIGATIPEKMWLDELGLKAAKYSMEGYAVDNETIAAFMKELQRSGSFGTVELLWAEQKEVEGVGLKHFSLVATLATPKSEAKQAEGNKAGTRRRPQSAKNTR